MNHSRLKNCTTACLSSLTGTIAPHDLHLLILSSLELILASFFLRIHPNTAVPEATTRLQVLGVAFDHGYSPSCNNNNHPRESPVPPAPLRVLCLQGIQSNNPKIDQPQDPYVDWRQNGTLNWLIMLHSFYAKDCNCSPETFGSLSLQKTCSWENSTAVFDRFHSSSWKLAVNKEIYTDNVCLSFCFWHLFFSPQKTLAVKKNFYWYMVLRQVWFCICLHRKLGGDWQMTNYSEVCQCCLVVFFWTILNLISPASSSGSIENFWLLLLLWEVDG